MKKSLVLLLSTLLVLSVFSVVPVSASSVNNLNSYVVDYENGISHAANSANSEIAVVSSGAHGSKNCLKFTQKNTGLQPDMYLVDIAANGNLGGKITEGSTVKVSFWLKLGQKLDKGNVLVLAHAPQNLNPTWTSGAYFAVSQLTTTFDYNSTDWQRVEMTAIADKDYVIGSVSLRFGGYNTSGANFVVGGTSDAPGDRVYYIDDLEFVTYSKGAIKEDVRKNFYDYYNGFEGNDVGYISYGTGAATMSVVTDTETQSSVLKFTQLATGLQPDLFILNENKADLNGTVGSGERITLSMKVKLGQRLDKGNFVLLALAPSDLNNGADMWLGRDYNTTFDPTSLEWQTINISFTSPAQYVVSKVILRFGGYAATNENYKENGSETDKGDRVYYIDDINFTVSGKPAEPEENIPVISDLKVKGEMTSGKFISFDYDFSGTTQSATDMTVAKLYATDNSGNKVLMASNFANAYYKIPDNLTGKKLTFEFIPADSTGAIGAPVTIDAPVLGSFGSDMPLVISFNDVGNVPEAKIKIDSNFATLYPDVSSVKFIITAYDANGKMIASKIESVSTVIGTTKTITLNGVDYVKVERLKCMVWSNDGKIIPIKDDITRVPAQSISCWGDSLTQGERSENIDSVIAVDERFASYSDISYSEVLAELSGKSVRNFGCGGDNATSIACRQGSLDMLIGTEFTIPADATTVEIDLDAENGIFINTLFQGTQNANLNPVIINGVEGTLSAVRHDDFNQLTEGTFHYTFTRSTAGEAVTVPANTKVIPASVREGQNGYAKKDIVVIFAGTNGGYNNSMDTLLGIIDGMIENLEYEDKEYVIVCYPHFGLSSAIQRGEAFEAKYGNRVVNLTELFRTDAEATFEKYGFTLTETDQADLAAGNLPTSLLISDGLHFNAVGNYILGCEIYETMLELGILTK